MSARDATPGGAFQNAHGQAPASGRARAKKLTTRTRPSAAISAPTSSESSSRRARAPHGSSA